MKQPKYYTQPEWLGGKRVLAKNVPDNFFSIYCEDSDANCPSEFKVMKHENNLCLTYAQFKKLFNQFGTRAEANAALRIIKKAYRGGGK